MATKYLRRLFFAFLILAGIAPSLKAQSAGYFIDTESGETRFIQRLVWTGGEYASRYEVVIERQVNGTDITYLREFTETPFIEVSLPPGNYRFQVISYDILDRIEEVSQWENIEVRRAVQPKISDVSLESETSGYTLNISGENFTPDSEFIIRNSDGTQIIPEVINYGEDGNASLFIESGAFTSNEYELVVKNPGGLETGIRGFVSPQMEEDEVVSESKIILFAGAALTPVFSAHGDFFGTGASFAGAGIHFGAAYPIPIGFHVGAELTAFWNLIDNTDDFTNVLSLGGNLLAMKWLPNQPMAITFKLGLSSVLLPDIQDRLLFNIGASYLWQFTDIFTLEAGLDYTVLIRENYFDGAFRPWIGVGIIF